MIFMIYDIIMIFMIFMIYDNNDIYFHLLYDLNIFIHFKYICIYLYNLPAFPNFNSHRSRYNISRG